MKYSIGDSVCVIKTNEIKKIIDFEFICDVEIYYMLDNTSYSLSEICEVRIVENINKLITENEEKIINLIDSLIDYKLIGRNWSKWLKKH